MPAWLQALLLGVVQGLTEFLPVSSSGHLVLAQRLLGPDFFAAQNALFFDLVLHVGTLLPVLHFYRADLARIVRACLRRPEAGQGRADWALADPDRRLAVAVALASIPTAAIGLTLEDQFEVLFSSVTPVCLALLITAALLVATRWTAGRAPRPLTPGRALVVGLVQGIAITPGISRSGSTIAASLFLGLPRAEAARFSFLMSVPAIAGAVLLKARHGLDIGQADLGAVAVGFLAAMASGYAALVLLVRIVQRGNLHRFAWYLVPLALLGLTALRG